MKIKEKILWCVFIIMSLCSLSFAHCVTCQPIQRQVIQQNHRVLIHTQTREIWRMFPPYINRNELFVEVVYTFNVFNGDRFLRSEQETRWWMLDNPQVSFIQRG